MDPEETAFLQSLGLTYTETIAKGGYGIIYLTHSNQYNSYFAVKKIPTKLFNEAEVACLKSFYDPNIVQLYNYYKFEDHVYMVMEYCPTDLEKIMKQRKVFTETELLRYSQDVICAIKACHDKNIAHCDIKPSNFLQDKYGRLKIGDFGLSSFYDQNYQCSLFKGTIIYMAPEIFGKDDYNPIVADIWAIGVTLYFMATRKYPFFSLDVNELKQKICAGKYDDTLIQNQNLRDVIAACLEVNPQLRANVQKLLSMPYFIEEEENLPLSGMNNYTRSHNLIVKPKLHERKGSALSLPQVLRSSRLNLLGSNSKCNPTVNAN